MHDLNITIVNERNPTSRNSKEVKTVSFRRTKRIAISENSTCMSIKYNDFDCASERCHYQVQIVSCRRCLVFQRNDNGFEIIMAKWLRLGMWFFFSYFSSQYYKLTITTQSKYSLIRVYTYKFFSVCLFVPWNSGRTFQRWSLKIFFQLNLRMKEFCDLYNIIESMISKLLGNFFNIFKFAIRSG